MSRFCYGSLAKQTPAACPIPRRALVRRRSSNRFLRMYEDAQGDLWAGTEEGGVVRYHQGRFTSYGKEQGLKSLNAFYLTGDSDGHVVVYLAADEVLRFIDGQFQPFSPPNK